MLSNEDVKQEMAQHLYDYQSECKQQMLLLFNSVPKIPIIAQTVPIWNQSFQYPRRIPVGILSRNRVDSFCHLYFVLIITKFALNWIAALSMEFWVVWPQKNNKYVNYLKKTTLMKQEKQAEWRIFITAKCLLLFNNWVNLFKMTNWLIYNI